MEWGKSNVVGKVRKGSVAPSPVLISLCGHSPAVLTETVWALAREKPPVIPERVVVITTRSGADILRKEILESGVWDRLRSCVRSARPDDLRFGDTGDAVRIIPAFDRNRELDDIRSAADSEAAADFILDVLRQFTADPTCRVILSVAGGRKTMSVLAAMALTLVGRPCDKMCHVLVRPPFDDHRLVPRFYFPDPAIPEYRLHKESGETVVECPDADVVTLADIPFVRFRYLFRETFGRLPGGYNATVSEALEAARRLAPAVALELDVSTGGCRINSIPLRLSALEFCLLWYFADNVRRAAPPVHGLKTLYTGVLTFLESRRGSDEPAPAFLSEAYNRLRFSDDPNSIRKPLYHLVGRFQRLGLSDAAFRRLSPVRVEDRGVYGIRLRPEEVRIISGAAGDRDPP